MNRLRETLIDWAWFAFMVSIALFLIVAFWVNSFFDSEPNEPWDDPDY